MTFVSKRYGKSFKESIKSLEADVQHANRLASEFPRDYDGACLQMRLSYSSAAHFFLYLVRWTDCSLAGALGFIRILIYKVYMDGTTTMFTHEKKASLREFYAYIYPSLQQLQGGITELEDLKQRVVCMERYTKKAESQRSNMTDLDAEREQECGICLEINGKIALPGCNHSMCITCFRDWHSRAQSCPFCRDSLKRVSSRDLWVFAEVSDTQDVATLAEEKLQRLFMYVDKLPLFVADDSHINARAAERADGGFNKKIQKRASQAANSRHV